jgi:formamidopyrimidine-DNA glycosylase
MPELPEVEVTRLSFADRIAGSQVLAVGLGKPLRCPLGCPPDHLCGQRVLGVSRRGKYLLVSLQRPPAGDGATPEAGVLLVHLGMSGSLQFAKALPAPGVHDHFSMDTTAGTLRLHDPRRFGAVVYADSLADPVAQRLLGHLGVEPLSPDFLPDAFVAHMKQRRAPIKQVLLAGDVVVGVGNIYACEVLFVAGIRPTVRADRVSERRLTLLHAAIRRVLSQAVSEGGSTLRNFSNADGQHGNFQSLAKVYGRQGQPCHVCDTPIRRIVQGQRSTSYCPVCQRG